VAQAGLELDVDGDVPVKVEADRKAKSKWNGRSRWKSMLVGSGSDQITVLTIFGVIDDIYVFLSDNVTCHI
jgi:hypothetical protein